MEYLNKKQASDVITGLDANKPTTARTASKAWAG